MTSPPLHVLTGTSLLAHPAHGPLGWGLVLAGFLSGALLGLAFHREDFWGGYGSFPRRVARLGHVALVALGVLNLLYASYPYPVEGTALATVATGGLVLGGVAMPLVCFLTSWRRSFRHLFAVPVLALAAAALSIVLGGPS